MRKFIHHLRRQPDHVKRHVLHVFTGVAAVVLFSLWVYSLGGNFNDLASKSDVKETLAPLSVLKNNLAMPKW
jgi:hypothetical protein